MPLKLDFSMGVKDLLALYLSGIVLHLTDEVLHSHIGLHLADEGRFALASL
ncbi:hypothetical protein LCL95_08400 [Bacillus timonensis]|nr:hypothetical protein [Bacillus timonensis]